MSYTVVREDDGVVIGVKRTTSPFSFIPKDPKNKQWQQFLAWNAVQVPPLDLSTKIDLPAYKARRFAEIVAKSPSLLSMGFSHGGRTFSLDASDLFTLTLIALKKGSAGAFPVKVITRNHRVFTINNATEFDAFCDAAIARYRQVEVRGAELRDAISTAADKATVDAVVDDRS